MALTVFTNTSSSQSSPNNTEIKNKLLNFKLTWTKQPNLLLSVLTGKKKKEIRVGLLQVVYSGVHGGDPP